MTVVSKPFDGEPDLLIGHEHDVLLVTDLDKNKVVEVPSPAGGWTHEFLEAYEREHLYPGKEYELEGWELFLGDLTNWIGGSEV